MVAPSDFDLQKAESSRGGTSSVALPPPDPDPHVHEDAIGSMQPPFQSSVRQKRRAPSESSNQRRRNQNPDEPSEHEDDAYGVRSKVRVLVREPENIKRLETNFATVMDDLRTISQEKDSLQQIANDLSEQLNKSHQMHEAMKKELEEVEERAKQELKEFERRSREELQRVDEENEVALDLVRQEAREYFEHQMLLEREELAQRIRGEVISTVEEQARDAVVQDAVARQSLAHETDRRAYEADAEERMNKKIIELTSMHERSMCERIAQDKTGFDMRIRDIQESHEKHINELQKSNEESMRERICEAEVEERMNRKITELTSMHEGFMRERVAQDKAEFDMRIRDIQESHEKQIDELQKSNEESMRGYMVTHPPPEEVLARYRPVLRQEILKELGVESETAMKEAFEENLRQIAAEKQSRQELERRLEDSEERLDIEVQNRTRLTAEAEQARQELEQRVQDRERCLEMEVQNVKRLELQLRSLENDRPVTNLDPTMDDGNVGRMDVDCGPSLKALGKRPDADAYMRDRSLSQMDDGGPSQEAPEMDAYARREALKVIHKRNTRFRRGTVDREMRHQESEAIRPPERFRRQAGCTSAIANRLSLRTPHPGGLNPRSDQPRGSTRNGERDSPSLRPSSNYSSARGPCPSTTFNPPGVSGFHQRDMSPPVCPPGVYNSVCEPGPAVIHHRDMSPQVNPPGGYCSGPSNTHRTDTSQIHPAAPGMSSSSQPSDTDLSFSDMFRAFKSEMQEMRNVLDQLVQPRESLITSRRTRREHGNYKLNPSQRPRTNARNDLMKAVRVEMNKLLGITRDIQIIDTAEGGLLTDLDEADQFNDGLIDGPPLEPLRVCWDNIKSLWNLHLADTFTNHLVTLKPEYDTEEKREEIRAHFMQRLEFLRKVLTKYIRKTDEASEDDAEAHYQNERLESLHEKRIQRRQAGLRDTRFQICQSGSLGGDNQAWDLLALMVQKLGVDGNSSDETDGEDRSYAVRFKEWRSKEVNELLNFIDDNRTHTNANGHNKPGTLPRKRIRRIYPPSSKDRPIACLPLNFYNKTWYDSLSSLQQVQLDAQPEMELPIIED